MWYFSNKAKLIRALDDLAFYNDKGCEYAKHTRDQIEQEQSKKVDRIRKLIAKIGENNFSEEFLNGLTEGKLQTDAEGRYINMVKLK